jgi:heme oxygenase (mycobilin-producing)
VEAIVSVLILVDIPAKPERVDDLKALFAVTMRDTRAFEGCEGVTLQASQDEPSGLLLVERWASRSHYENYAAWRQTDAGATGIGDLLAGPPTARFFDDVAV